MVIQNSYNSTWNEGDTLEIIEERAIRSAFHYYKGVKTTTAQSLGISVRCLDDKIKLYMKKDEDERVRQEARKRKAEEFLARARGVPYQPQAPKQQNAQAPKELSELTAEEILSQMDENDIDFEDLEGEPADEQQLDQAPSVDVIKPATPRADYRKQKVQAKANKRASAHS